MPITDELAVRAWKAHPVTEKFFKLVREALHETTEKLIAGEPLYSKRPALNYADLVGFIHGLKFLLDADLVEEEEITDVSEY